MLKKVVSIQGLGLLHGSGASPEFRRSTLLFADNGRGKSTFTTLLESVRSGDLAELSRLQTIDQATTIEAKLVFDGGVQLSQLSGEGWDHLRPNVRVFDSHFVRENVYSGSVIEATQRRNLLTFVLGDSAVGESTRERIATKELAEMNTALRNAESSLTPLLNGTNLAEFMAFAEDTELATKILRADLDIENHKSSAQIALLPEPAPISILDPHLDEVLELLALSLEDIHNSATELVEAHISVHAHDEFEEWIRAGSQFEDEHNCPYCGQSIERSELIAAYRQFFSAEYFGHVEQVKGLAGSLTETIGPAAIQDLTRRVAQQQRVTSDWAGRTILEELEFDEERVQQLFGALYEEVLRAIHQKSSSPLESMDVTELGLRVKELWEGIEESFASFNGVIARNSAQVRTFKESLVTADLPALEIARNRLEAQRLRYTPSVQAVVAQIVSDRESAAALERERDDAREKIRQLMNDTLTSYQDTINDLLTKFGAGFSVKEMRTSFRGPAPQSEYVIVLRTKEVPLWSDSGPHFDTALSEGDKRTLAFAFFVARVLQDPDIAQLVVAVDDPMSSMDAGRRHTTIQTLIKLQNECRQLILSSHDAVFLRDFQLELGRRLPNIPRVVVQLLGPAGGYSNWASPSLDELCESARRKTLREVEQFLDTGQGDPQLVARQIRPLLEGYLHSRFPTLLKEGLLLGESIQAIRAAVAPSPLAFAQNIVDEIESINTYAGAFHHDGNPGYVRPIANAVEVQSFAARSLNLTYSGMP